MLLCSDGLSDALPADRLGAILRVGPPDGAAANLLEAALAAGAPDNVSLVVIDLDPADSEAGIRASMPQA
jgi:protein phosphatase